MPGLTVAVTGDAFNRLDKRLYETPVRNAMLHFAEAIERRAKASAPRDTNRLAESLHAYVSPGLRNAGVRTNNRYASYVHGRHALPAPPRRRSEPHFPPDNASLRGWASRHGIPVRMVQLAIWKRGTPIVPFISEAAEAELRNISRYVREAERDIERNWRR